MQLKRPPIDLPENPEIRFLETPAEICEEGIRMGHCVETFSLEAIEGSAFIFHVEKDGESATVAVNAQGQVTQARGPLNERNRACKWATRVLRRWGRAMPQPIASQETSEEASVAEMEEVPF